MKNLKKVLSLALVFAMVLGLCIGAMAADTQDVTKLTDWDSVTHKEAATLLNAFNIMQGYPSGTFQPERTVTRAEAVKMIDVGLWGGVDQPELFASNDVAFTDVKTTDWYAGHVTYAQALGILDGFTDGTFRPNDTVTGYQMLKMALIALNYRSEAEGLTGAGWDIRTMRLATDPTVKNLTDGLSDITNWNAPLTRDQAAQIIYNMIQHNTVTYSLMTNNQGGYVKNTTGPTFGEMYLNMVVDHGYLYANDKGSTVQGTEAKTIDSKLGNAIIDVPEVKDENGTVVVKPYQKPVTLDSDLLDLGTPVSLYYKGATLLGVALDGWTEVEPIYNTSGVITNKATDAKTYNIGEKALYDDHTYIDTNNDGIIDIETIVNYADTATVNDIVETEKWGTIYQTGTTAWRTSYEKNASLRTGFIKADNIGAAKGDKIAYVASANANGASVNVGVILNPVDGQVSRVTTANNTSTYYIDGVGYGAVAGVVGDKKVEFAAKGTFYTFPGTSTIVAFDAAKDSAANTSYALLYDAGYTSTGASTAIGGGEGSAVMSVAAILPDGTKTTFTVDGIKSGTSITSLKNLNNVRNILNTGDLENLNNHDLMTGADSKKTSDYLVTYYLNDDGNMIINSIESLNKTITGAQGGTKIDSTTAKFGDDLITSNTVTFIQTSVNDTAKKTTEDWTVAIGSTASYTIDATKEVSYKTDTYGNTNTNYVTYAVVELSDVVTATESKSAFYYVVSNNGRVDTTSEGAAIYEVTLYDASADEIITVKTTTDAGVGAIYTTIQADGSLIDDNNFNSSAKTGYVTSFDNGIISLTSYTTKANAGEKDTPFNVPSTEAILTNKDTKFFYIDGTDSEEITASEVTTQGEVEPAVKAVYDEATGETFEKFEVTVKYGAMVVTDEDSVATTVILFGADRSAAKVDVTPKKA